MNKVSNQSLGKARDAKQDEFYTQLGDISNEVKHYKTQLHGKTIFCNCDDPYESNFFKYFALNFKSLGLKKLIATSYKGSPIIGTQLILSEIDGAEAEIEGAEEREKPDREKSISKEPYAIEIKEILDYNQDGAIDLNDVTHLIEHDANTHRKLNGNGIYGAGDFRSRECVELLKQSDIVVTNPPFSLFREYVTQLVEHDKQFLIIGNKNAITYREIFLLMQQNKLRTGYRNINSDMWFEVPDGAVYEKIDNGKKVKHIMATWLTNLAVEKHSEMMTLYKQYTPAEYPKFDNYDAINVDKVADIPVDYFGVMGVPITFIDKYSPEQFEIVGSDYDVKEGLLPDIINPNWAGKLDRGYVSSQRMYSRLLIKHKAYHGNNAQAIHGQRSLRRLCL